MRFRGFRVPRAINYAPLPIESTRQDLYSQRLGMAPVIDGNYYPILNLRNPNVEHDWNFGDYAIGANWPRVPAIYGVSQRTGAGASPRNGGALKAGVPNTNRWTTQNLQAYLIGEGMARQSIYSPTPVNSGG